MFYADISFCELPETGFAHHFFTENYREDYGYEDDDSFELVYIKKGKISVELYGERFFADEGSVFVLFRSLPFRLLPADGTYQSHCSIQLSVKHRLRLVSDSERSGYKTCGILLPLVTPPSDETEIIKRSMYSITAMLGASRAENAFSASLAAAGILHCLSAIYCERRSHSESSRSVLSYKIKKYISEHLSENIRLSDISRHLGKTPNYLNGIFKSENGVSIMKYMSLERVRFLCELLSNKNLTFADACENAGIYDVSYGYRLFKKHMGMTPGEYLASPSSKK